MGKTTKTTDWLGREKEEHFNDAGEKSGETRFTTDWLGNRVQEHFNTENEKVGETKAGHDWLGRDRAEHFDHKHNRVGTSKNEEDWLGNDVQRHYNESRERVGETRYKEDWLGRSFKEHKGDYPKVERSRESSDFTSVHCASNYESSGAGPIPSSKRSYGLLLFTAFVGFAVILGWIISERTSREVTSQAQLPRPSDQLNHPIRSSHNGDIRRIPLPIRKLLDREYPQWSFPQAPVEDLKECRQPNSQFLPGVVWGDFDGDGKLDYGLAIEQRRKIYTLVFLAASTGYREFSLKPSGWTILGVEPRGSTLPRVGVGADGAFGEQQSVVVNRDTLIGIACSKSSVAYTYENNAFQYFFMTD